MPDCCWPYVGGSRHNLGPPDPGVMRFIGVPGVLTGLVFQLVLAPADPGMYGKLGRVRIALRIASRGFMPYVPRFTAKH